MDVLAKGKTIGSALPDVNLKVVVFALSSGLAANIFAHGRPVAKTKAVNPLQQ